MSWEREVRDDDGCFILRAGHINDVVIGVEAFAFEVLPGEGPIFDGPAGRTICIGTTDINEATPLFEGSFKWDGCSDLLFARGEYLHSCSGKEVRAIGVALAKAHEIAKELLGREWDGGP